MFQGIKRVIARFMDSGTKLPEDTPAKKAVQTKIVNPLKFINASAADPRVKNLAKRYANAGQGAKLRELADQVYKQYGG